jgi:hypothetical protein
VRASTRASRLSAALAASVVLAGPVLLAGPTSAQASVRPGASAEVKASSVTIPFSDPNAHGSIGLCDRNEHPITSGNVKTQPFAWTVVSSVPAPKGYNDTKTSKAQLLAFQPRPQVPPGDWSGEQLTASSFFTNSQHPMAQATVGDLPLLFFVQAYPPMLHGLIQLRIYFTAINRQPYSISYPATVIQVTGNTWRVVSSGPTADCKAGKATSAESLQLSQSALQSDEISSPKPKTSASHPAGANGSHSASPGSSSSPGAQAAGQSNSVPADQSTSDRIAIGLLALLVLGVLAAGVVWWRLRRAP